MSEWPGRPVIYEINTWVWLHDIGRRHQRPVTLASIPSEEWDALSALGIDAVWLMGIWERSPAGTRIARDGPDLKAVYRASLPDYSDPDVTGSPYAVHKYTVDEHFGGPAALSQARSMLARRGIRLILDFVPNHVARDNSWVTEHPDYFIHGDADDLRRQPDGFFAAGGRVVACGRDPYFPPWTDTAQLNAFHPQLRKAAMESLRQIAAQCDGVRCDMAMLLINRVFEETWGRRAGRPPEIEFWQEVIQAVRRPNHGFLFLAEAYWDLESELQQQGFDYCYDKRLYDRLVHGHAEDVQLHLQSDPAYQDKLVRFLENHDEPRAAEILPFTKLCAASLAVASLPGAKLFHEGQFEGRRVKLPVQLGRRGEEKTDEALRAFYDRLRGIVQTAGIREAEWKLCERSGWPDNESYRNIVAWAWRKQKEQYLVVVNFSDLKSQARIRMPWKDLPQRALQLRDLFSGILYERAGSEMLDPGLYVDLPPWGYHFFQIRL